MRDFIAHNAKFVLDWGQLILVLAIIIGLGIIYMLGRKNKYHLPRGIFGWLSAVLSLFFIVLSVLAFVGITMEKPHTGVILQQFEEIKEGKAPNLSFKLVSDDTEHDISEYFGNVILVNIWATWCPPCRKGLPKLQEFATWAEQEGVAVKVFAVNMGEHVRTNEQKRRKVQQFWQRQGFTMPTLMDYDDTVA
ncbi:TlpA family protein disulfide reductase, partial [candidate division KSB1 bacterium]|nr:TlpA family protein disulfide reductase [candidate division KSB1 bacterium]